MSRFVICINNDNNRVSLIVGKVYRPLIDDEAEARSLVRIIDEDKSETDGYVYPSTILKRYQALRRRISFTDGTGRAFKSYYIERRYQLYNKFTSPPGGGLSLSGECLIHY